MDISVLIRSAYRGTVRRIAFGPDSQTNADCIVKRLTNRTQAVASEFGASLAKAFNGNFCLVKLLNREWMVGVCTRYALAEGYWLATLRGQQFEEAQARKREQETRKRAGGL